MNNRTSQAGFTLIEVVVASTVFIFAVVSVADLFSQALRIQRQALAIRRVAENVQFVVESVSREVRVSRVTSADSDCNPPDIASRTLAIEHPVNGTIVYAYDPSRGAITRQQTGYAPQDITTADVSFALFAFCVTGSGPDGRQARVTMPMSVQALGAGGVTPAAVSLQTTISSRDIYDDLSQ